MSPGHDGGTIEQSQEADTLLADKAYDADKRVIEPLAAHGQDSGHSPEGQPYDLSVNTTGISSRSDHLIENFFAKLKQFPRTGHQTRSRGQA